MTGRDVKTLRLAIVAIAVASLALGAGCSARLGDKPARVSRPKVTATSRARVASSVAMEQSIAKHYGSLLDTVTVSDTTNTVTMGSPYAAGTYRLKGLPLVFPFEVLFGRGRWSEEIFGGAEGVRAVTHSDIGGVVPFVKLAQQYHRDFPDQKSMSYWRTDDNQVNETEPYHSILRGHSGLSVVVYDHDDYWGGRANSVQLGIYWWDKGRRDWALIHRGDLPDLR